MKVFSKNAQIPESLYLITSSTKMKTYFQVDTLKVPTQISSELALLFLLDLAQMPIRQSR